MSLLDNGENQVSQKRFILTIELPYSICTPPSRLVSFPDPLAIETFQVRRRTCLLRPKIRLNGAFPGRVFHYYALLLSLHIVLHYMQYAVCTSTTSTILTPWMCYYTYLLWPHMKCSCSMCYFALLFLLTEWQLTFHHPLHPTHSIHLHRKAINGESASNIQNI